MRLIIKSLLILFFISITEISFAQTSDSTKIRLEKLELQMKNLQWNLDKCHKQFRIGFLTILGGGIVTASAFSPIIPSENNPSYIPGSIAETKKILVITGSAIQIIGLIVLIDSHSYIGDCKNLSFKGNGVSYSF